MRFFFAAKYSMTSRSYCESVIIVFDRSTLKSMGLNIIAWVLTNHFYLEKRYVSYVIHHLLIIFSLKNLREKLFLLNVFGIKREKNAIN